MKLVIFLLVVGDNNFERVVGDNLVELTFTKCILVKHYFVHIKMSFVSALTSFTWNFDTIFIVEHHIPKNLSMESFSFFPFFALVLGLDKGTGIQHTPTPQQNKNTSNLTINDDSYLRFSPCLSNGNSLSK